MTKKENQVSMEKILKPYDKELMKMAMLKHEETFKQQVYELHRLYRVQKVLMKDVVNNKVKKENQQTRESSTGELSFNQTNSNARNFHPKPQLGFDLDEELEIQDESKIQLTLGPTRYNRRKNSRTSHSGASFTSSSTGSRHFIKGYHQENLTWGLATVKTESYSVYQNTKNSYCVQDQSSLGRLNGPSWLSQALSLNMS